jgi:hypothetical protein
MALIKLVVSWTKRTTSPMKLELWMLTLGVSLGPVYQQKIYIACKR